MPCSSPALRRGSKLQAVAAATTLPIVLGNTQGELDDAAFLVSQRVRIALQGHTPFAAATQAVHDTLKALREGTPPKDLKGIAVAATDQSPDARCRRQSAQPANSSGSGNR